MGYICNQHKHSFKVLSFSKRDNTGIASQDDQERHITADILTAFQKHRETDKKKLFQCIPIMPVQSMMNTDPCLGNTSKNTEILISRNPITPYVVIIKWMLAFLQHSGYGVSFSKFCILGRTIHFSC